ncbi:hypothetical protein L3i23_04360 [Herbiconiux sp. L3-i23]|nr:hypothetical protein L3i23_04360 [Herbiconiux sp. L3-i23]
MYLVTLIDISATPSFLAKRTVDSASSVPPPLHRGRTRDDRRQPLSGGARGPRTLWRPTRDEAGRVSYIDLTIGSDAFDGALDLAVATLHSSGKSCRCVARASGQKPDFVITVRLAAANYPTGVIGSSRELH